MSLIVDTFASWKLWLGSLGLAILYPLGLLLWPLAFPTIHAYPWKAPEQQKNDTVIIAGSFNPPHYGHYAMLQFLAKKHAKVICVVGHNKNKKYAATAEQRAILLRKMLPESIEVHTESGYIWRYGKTRDCRTLYRGIRSWQKDGTDERALQILNTWGPLLLGPTWPIPTHYLEGQPEYNHISSTLIRDLVAASGTDAAVKKELAKLVPDCVVDEVLKLYAPKEEEQ
jgi:cytidyltransferase-like protein